MLACGDVAVEEKPCVGRRIITPVKIFELFIGEFGDKVGISAGIKSIDTVGVQIFLNGFVHQRVSGGVGAFHFIIDDARDSQLAR